MTRVVLDKIPDSPKVIVPPLPRYLSAGCCSDSSHCKNRADPKFGEKILESVGTARAVIKEKLMGWGTKNFRVLDGIGALAGSGSGIRPNKKDLIQALSRNQTRDGVHWNQEGQKNLAQGIAGCFKTLMDLSRTNDTAANPVSGRQFFWRGFRSPSGSSARSRIQAHGTRGGHHRGGRGGGAAGQPGGRGAGRHHPYKKRT